MKFDKDSSRNVERIIDHYTNQIFDLFDTFHETDEFETYQREEFDGKFWIAGGCLRDFCRGKRPVDIDLFFPSEEDYLKVKKHLVEERGFEVKFENDNADKMVGEYNGLNLRIDLVKRWFKSPEDTIDAFDFTVAQAALDRENFYCSEEFLFDMMARRLVVHKLPFPVSSMRRIPKYLKKGFTVCKGTMQDLAAAVAAMTPEQVQAQEGLYFD